MHRASRKSKATLSRARRQALDDWRVLPEKPDPARRQQQAREVVPRVLKMMGLDERLDEERIAAAWPSIVGEFIARHSKPQRLKRGVLAVAVGQPTILWTLDRARGTVLGRLQEEFGSELIREVRFRAG